MGMKVKHLFPFHFLWEPNKENNYFFPLFHYFSFLHPNTKKKKDILKFLSLMVSISQLFSFSFLFSEDTANHDRV